MCRKCLKNRCNLLIFNLYFECSKRKNKLFLREKQVVFSMKTTCMGHQRSVDAACVGLSLKGVDRDVSGHFV